jgi:hypothetical protein
MALHVTFLHALILFAYVLLLFCWCLICVCPPQVYQRQLSKEGLQSVIGAGEVEETASSIEDLRDLFTLQTGTLSDTHDTLECECMSDERTVCV